MRKIITIILAGLMLALAACASVDSSVSEISSSSTHSAIEPASSQHLPPASNSPPVATSRYVEGAVLLTSTDANNEYLVTDQMSILIDGPSGGFSRSEGYYQFTIRLPLNVEFNHFGIYEAPYVTDVSDKMAEISACLQLQEGDELSESFDDLDTSKNRGIKIEKYQGVLGNIIYYSIIEHFDDAYFGVAYRYYFYIQTEQDKAIAMTFYTRNTDYTVDEPLYREIAETIQKA